MCAMLEFENIVINIPTTDTTMYFYLHVVAQRQTDFLGLFS
jgi:hypothetical protein